MQENRSFDSYFGTYPGRRRHPDAERPARPCACPTRDRAAASSPYPRPRRRQRRRPARRRPTRPPTSTAARWTASSRRPSRRSKGCADPNNPACSDSADARRDGLPRRDATSRTTGPTPRTSCCRTTCSSRTPRGACPSTCSWSPSGRPHCTQHDDPIELHERSCRHPGDPPRLQRDDAAATRHGATRSTPGPTSPTCCTRTTCRWGYYVVDGTEPDCENDAAVTCAAGAAERQDAGHLEPAALLRHGAAGRPARQHPVRRRTSTPRPRTAPCPRCPGSCRPARSASTRRRQVSAGQAYVTSLDQRGHAGPRLELAPRSSWPGTTGAASTTTSRRRPSTRTATACACPGWSSARTRKTGYIDHQTLSFDAYVKFIEDDFLGGQRLDPDDRRPARPAARRPRERAAARRPDRRLRLQPAAAASGRAARPSRTRTARHSRSPMRHPSPTQEAGPILATILPAKALCSDVMRWAATVVLREVQGVLILWDDVFARRLLQRASASPVLQKTTPCDARACGELWRKEDAVC